MLDLFFKMGIYLILRLLFQMFESFVTKYLFFCFCVQFLVKFCTNPLIRSGEIFYYVFDVVSLASISTYV